jgi:hypothetical protein
MALERTALRLATVMLLSNGFNAPFPTIAGARVYDSRIDGLAITDGTEMFPIIKVCTDDDNGSSLSTNNGGFPFEHTVTLSLDLSIAIPNEDRSEVFFAATESDLELYLDQFEAQIEYLMTARPGIWGAHFNKLARRIENVNSVRFVEPDGNTRIAARQLQMSIKLPVNQSTAGQFVIAPATGLPLTVPAPLGPLLTDIITNSPAFAADAERIRDTIINGLPPPTVLEPLNTLRIIEDERDSQNRKTTERPDGVAEVTFPT